MNTFWNNGTNSSTYINLKCKHKIEQKTLYAPSEETSDLCVSKKRCINAEAQGGAPESKVFHVTSDTGLYYHTAITQQCSENSLRQENKIRYNIGKKDA